MELTGVLYTGASEEEKKIIRPHLIYEIENPESEFAEKLAEIRSLSEFKNLEGHKLLDHLPIFGYDAFAMFHYNRLLGYQAFQQHGNNWEGFKIRSLNEGEGYAKLLSELWIEEASRNGVERLRFGAGGNDISYTIIDHLAEKEEELGITILEDFWVEIVR